MMLGPFAAGRRAISFRVIAAAVIKLLRRHWFRNPSPARRLIGEGDVTMAASARSLSGKAFVVILALVGTTAASLAQATGGVGGSSGASGGVANSPAPPPGTNSLGTAQSSGTAAGRTTGTGTGGSTDAAVAAENRLLDKKLKSICRGC
jgi:hypothetical protein